MLMTTTFYHVKMWLAMAQIDVAKLRSGTVFEEEGVPWIVLKYEHVKMGRGSATIKVKIRNLIAGSVLVKSFTNGARVTEVLLERRLGQYLYQNGNFMVFMNTATYEQFEIDKELIGDQAKFLKEGTEVELKFYGDEAISIVLPLKMKFVITETEPGYKGNSVTNIYKDATLETGANIKVPMFVEMGESVIVNTETGEYVERAK